MINISRAFEPLAAPGIVKDLKITISPAFSPEIKVKPGMLDKLEFIESAGIRDDDPLLLSLIPVKEFLEFTNQTKIHWSEETEDILFGKPYAEVVSGGLFERIIYKFKGYKLVHSEKIERYIPIAEVHRPKIKDCKSTFCLSSKDSSDYSFSVKVFGFGGGFETSTELGRTVKITADTSCLYYCVPVKFRIQVYSDNIRSFQRVELIEILDGHEVIPIPVRDDKCEMSPDKVKALGFLARNFRHENASGSFTEEIFLNVGSKAEWDWGLKLNLPVMGEVNEGIKGSVEALKTISYSYDLSGMHNYTAYNAQNSLSFYWDWNPKAA